MQVAAAALVALAAASATAGWYSLGALVLGAVFVCALGGGAGGSASSGGGPEWLPAGLAAAAAVSRVALFAAVFAAYLVPEHAAWAAPVFVLVVAVADIAGVRIDTYYQRWLLGLLLVIFAVFLAVCLAIPVAPHARLGAAGAAPPGVGAALLAVAVATVPFSGMRTGALRGARRYATVAAAVAGLVAVAAAAMYQLGSVRFGLSATSLRAVFAASDARTLLPVLVVAVVLATVPAVLLGLAQARRALGADSSAGQGAGWRERARLSLPAAVAAAVLAGTLGPVPILVVCAAVVLFQTLVPAVRRLLRERAVRPAGAAVVAAALLVVLPTFQLLIGVVVAAAGVGAAALWRRAGAPG